MPALLLGLIVLVLVLWALNIFSKADPKRIAPLVRRAGGGLALALAVYLGLRGELGVAVPLGAFGLGLLGWLPGVTGFAQRLQKKPGQSSRVRSAFLEMELDHDSGTIGGRILKGRYANTPLDALDIATLASLLGEMDEDSRGLMVAYLDRRNPRWREDANAGATAGAGLRSSGKMTEEEAYQILGLKPGASARDISQAHRSLMKKLHPDQGGSTFLAARVNEAKDVLLRRHR